MRSSSAPSSGDLTAPASSLCPRGRRAPTPSGLAWPPQMTLKSASNLEMLGHMPAALQPCPAVCRNQPGCGLCAEPGKVMEAPSLSEWPGHSVHLSLPSHTGDHTCALLTICWRVTRDTAGTWPRLTLYRAPSAPGWCGGAVIQEGGGESSLSAQGSASVHHLLVRWVSLGLSGLWRTGTSSEPTSGHLSPCRYIHIGARVWQTSIRMHGAVCDSSLLNTKSAGI